MPGLSNLSPAQIKFTFLCNRWAELKGEIGYLKEHFLAGHGSAYLFEKLQDYTEEYEQLDALLIEINQLDKKMIKKTAA